MTCVLNLVVTSYLANEPLKLLKDLTRKAYPLGLLAIAAALVAGESIGYIFSFLNDETTSAVLHSILNTVWAATMGYVVLREELRRRDFALLCVGAAVVVVMFFAEWWSSPPATQTTTSTTSQLESPFVGDREAANLELAVIEDTQAATPIGILVALMTGVCVAALLTFSRYVEKACPQGKPALLVAPCVGNFFAVLTSLCSMLLLGPTKAGGIWNQGTDGPTFLALSAASACFDAAFYVGVILAPQYITASEIALVLLLEVFFAPLWVYLFLVTSRYEHDHFRWFSSQPWGPKGSLCTAHRWLGTTFTSAASHHRWKLKMRVIAYCPKNHHEHPPGRRPVL